MSPLFILTLHAPAGPPPRPSGPRKETHQDFAAELGPRGPLSGDRGELTASWWPGKEFQGRGRENNALERTEARAGEGRNGETTVERQGFQAYMSQADKRGGGGWDEGPEQGRRSGDTDREGRSPEWLVAVWRDSGSAKPRETEAKNSTYFPRISRASGLSCKPPSRNTPRRCARARRRQLSGSPSPGASPWCCCRWRSPPGGRPRARGTLLGGW